MFDSPSFLPPIVLNTNHLFQKILSKLNTCKHGHSCLQVVSFFQREHKRKHQDAFIPTRSI